MPRPHRKPPRGRDISGWLIVDKPSGIGSTDVVARCKRAFDARKCGHGGTLDPLATGLLPIAFGAATKTVPYVMDGTKVYRFTLRFGDARPTDDAIRAALPAFTGDIMQVPPAYSAIKVGGERAYDLAREGQAVALEARPARVDRFELVARPDADHAEFEVQSGKGVYMRSLARDLARALGTVGHIAALRRLRVGPFTEAHAVPLPVPGEAPEAALLPLDMALAEIPALPATEAEAARLGFGQALSLVEFLGRVPAAADPEGGLVRVMAGERFVGLCRLGDGLLRPERLMAA
jgi:tRNA pseudouridine55 synthase